MKNVLNLGVKYAKNELIIELYENLEEITKKFPNANQINMFALVLATALTPDDVAGYTRTDDDTDEEPVFVQVYKSEIGVIFE